MKSELRLVYGLGLPCVDGVCTGGSLSRWKCMDTKSNFTHKIWNNYSFVAVCLLRYSGILRQTTVVWCLHMYACVFKTAWIAWSKVARSGEYSRKVTIRFMATVYLHGIGALRNTPILRLAFWSTIKHSGRRTHHNVRSAFQYSEQNIDHGYGHCQEQW